MTLPIHLNKPPRNAVNAYLGGHDRLLSDTKCHGDGTPLFDAFDGTYGEEIDASARTLVPPSCVMELPYCNERDHGSVTASDSNTASYRNPPLHNATARDVDASITRAARDTARILRAHRLDELLTSIHAWASATCIERAYWRSTARWQLAEFRRLHLHPERRAFEAAVARSRQQRSHAP